MDVVRTINSRQKLGVDASMLDDLPGVCLLTDELGRVTKANTSAHAFFEFRPGTPGQKLDEFLQQQTQLQPEQLVFDQQLHLWLSAGGHYLCQLSPLRSPSEGYLFQLSEVVSGSNIHVTEQAILATFPDELWVVNGDGYGYDAKTKRGSRDVTPAEVMHLSKLSFVDESRATALQIMIAECLASQTAQSCEFDLAGQSDRAHYDVRMSPLNDNEVVMIVRDMAEQQTQQLKRLASLPEQNPYPVVELDLKGEVNYVNSAGLKCFPKLKEQGLQHPLFQGWRSILTTLGQHSSWTREVSIGQQVYEETICLDLNAELIRVFIFDITESKQLLKDVQTREETLSQLLENNTDVVYIIDAQANVVYTSANVKRVLGFERINGSNPVNLLDFVHPDDVAKTRGFLQGILLSSESQQQECRVLTASGHYLEVEIWANNLLANPAVNGVVLNIRDISQRNADEYALRESEERYALAARGANDGLWDWNLVSGKVYYAERWLAMLQLEQAVPTIDTWFSRLHDNDKGRVSEHLEAYLEGRSEGFDIDYLLRCEDGRYSRMNSRAYAVRDKNNKVIRLVGWQSDLSERVATYDALTNLPSRQLFIERLNRAILYHQQEAYQFAVLYLDLDQFKVINDSLGHAAGDELLVEAAQRLELSLRTQHSPELPYRFQDTIARFGGDEFAILLENIHGTEDVIKVAERIHEAFSQPFVIQDHQVLSTTSLGIALSDSGYNKAEDMLRDADIAMYRAKSKGKNRFILFDQAMYEHIKERLTLETNLRRAIEQQEFFLVYHPIVDLKQQRLKGFEALIRWQHPQDGLIAPLAFIPVAEESGLIVELGKWVLETACQQMHDWTRYYPQAKDWVMNVNLSARQLEQHSVVPFVAEVLGRTGIAPTQLALEVTEGMIMTQAELALDILKQLRELGCAIHIDDFGTGYSSLSRLHDLPVDVLKIDRSFVSRSDTPESAGIIQTIITLAETLQLEVVAEGVETLEHVTILQTLHCTYAQGYLYTKPLKAEELTAFLEDETLLQRA